MDIFQISKAKTFNNRNFNNSYLQIFFLFISKEAAGRLHGHHAQYCTPSASIDRGMGKALQSMERSAIPCFTPLSLESGMVSLELKYPARSKG